MKTFRQLFRQPMKTLMGVLLVTIAVGVLCVCVGQTIAAYRTERFLERTFQTAAFPKASYTRESDDWVHSFAKDNRRVVETIHSPGLVSAYLPDLFPDNYSHRQGLVTHPEQYPQAVLVLRVTDAGQPYSPLREGINGMVMTRTPNSWYQEASEDGTLEWKQAPPYIPIYDEYGDMVARANEIDLDFRDLSGSASVLSAVSVNVSCVVEEAVGLEAGYSDPAGYTASFPLRARSTQELDALDLKPGARFLVYASGYQDDWWLRNHKAEQLNLPMVDFFDPERIHIFTKDERNNPDYIASYSFGTYVHGLTPAELEQVRTLYLTIPSLSPARDAFFAIDESAQPLWVIPGHLEYKYDNRYACVPGGETPVYPVKEVLSDRLTFINALGETKTVLADEYHARYPVPTVARLDGSVEKFLESPQGALWKQTLADMEISNHSFPMVGVSQLRYLPDFLRDKARIIQGRDFTKEELKTGAKVCLISEFLAEKNGLTLGSVLSPQLYNADPDLPGQASDLSHDPVARFFHGGTTQLEEAEDYTVVGIYQKDYLWDSPAANEYCFTPNTIFVPKAALPDWQLEGYQGMFRTVVLHGRGFRAFMEAAAENGLDGQLYYFDNGYTAVAQGLDGYRVIAGRVFAIGLTVYTILMTLYLLLYPTQQQKTLTAMDRLGASRRQQISQVFFSGVGILVPGTVLGAAFGALLWNRVVQALLHSAQSDLTVNMEGPVLLLVAAAQLLFSCLLTLLTAIPLSSSRGISERR